MDLLTLRSTRLPPTPSRWSRRRAGIGAWAGLLALLAACGNASPVTLPDLGLGPPDASGPAADTEQPDAIVPDLAVGPDAGNDLGIDAGPPGPVTITFDSRPASDAAWTPTTRSYWGDAIRVRLGGLRPGDTVTVGASTGPYSSSADFTASDQGTVDLAADAPVSGSYTGVDADGIFWSMTGPADAVADFPVAFTATLSGQQVAQATLQRYWWPDGSQPVNLTFDQDGLVGGFMAPPGQGPFPALIAFGGSEGGTSTGELLAGYYASQGFAVLGLGYFGAPGLPQQLTDVPLEYFRTALDWLKQRPEVDPTRIGVMGGSRGGELALLLGATYSDFKAVVANVPSGLVWGAAETANKGAWTLNGAEVPYMPSSGAGPELRTIDGKMAYVSAPMFLADIAAASPQALDAATIRVENTQGPVLMIGGSDDLLWQSCTLAQIAVDRLNQTGHSQTHADGFECYQGAGHEIFQPNTPTTGSTLVSFGLLYPFALGGNPADSAHANRQSDERIRTFLQSALGPTAP
jgi:dienelactone hydrolase